MILALDLEANELLYKATKIWCIVSKDIETNIYYIYYILYNKEIESQLKILFKEKNNKYYTTNDLKRYIGFINKNKIITHNGYNYDIPLLNKFGYYLDIQLEDTFILSSLFEPDRSGGHSLERWGEDLGIAKKQHTDWTRFSWDMLERCIIDVDITEALWYNLSKERSSWDWEDSIQREYRCAIKCNKMETHGVVLNVPKAKEVLHKINTELNEVDTILLDNLPLRCVPNKTVVTKPFKKDGTYTKQVLDYFKEEELI